MQPVWFETFFQGVAVEAWSLAIPPSVTVSEVDALMKILDLVPGSHVLDVPCGHGRHVVEFARRGYRVTGIDLSADALQLASDNARGTVDLRYGDMRSLQIEAGAYDGAVCLGNSFGYLDHTGATAFLRSISQALRPGAGLVIDFGTAAESILPSLTPQRWHRVGDILMLSQCRYAAEWSRVDIDYTFIQNGIIETRATSSYVTTAAELRRTAEGAGFTVTGLYASFALDPYALGSPRLIFVARKT